MGTTLRYSIIVLLCVLNLVLLFIASSTGYFVDPTIIQVTDPKNKLMEEVCYQSMYTILCVCVCVCLVTLCVSVCVCLVPVCVVCRRSLGQC